ncbi:hypothetical protein RUM43_013718 [Polyplax serrata]|uniref:Uncharacterized protein n=1 Tax=Polyplax serrata TaxID=468196 RepID=A0AAN8P5M7_POLSC
MLKTSADETLDVVYYPEEEEDPAGDGLLLIEVSSPFWHRPPFGSFWMLISATPVALSPLPVSEGLVSEPLYKVGVSCITIPMVMLSSVCKNCRYIQVRCINSLSLVSVASSEVLGQRRTS